MPFQPQIAPKPGVGAGPLPGGAAAPTAGPDFATMNEDQLRAYLAKARRNNPNDDKSGVGAAAQAANAGQPNSLQGQIDFANVAQATTNGWNQYADPNAYLFGGTTHGIEDERNRYLGLANQVGQNQAPQISQQQIGQQQQIGDRLNSLGMNGGEGTGLAGQAGRGLLALGQMPAGPSAAELAMTQQAGALQAGQASLAAGQRGGNAGLGLLAASRGQAALGGQLTNQLGVQRAQEDMANRAFSANALGSAAGVFGGQNAQQQGAYGAASGAYGAGANIAGQNAQLQAGQNALNQQGQIAYNSAATGIGQQGVTNLSNLDNERTDNYMRYRFGEQAADQASHNKDSDDFKSYLAAGTAAAGVAAAPMTGGASIPVATGVAGGIKSSDVRAKKDIAPAGKAVGDAFGAFGDSMAGRAPQAPAQKAAAQDPVVDPSGYDLDAYQFGAPKAAAPIGVQRRAPMMTGIAPYQAPAQRLDPYGHPFASKLTREFMPGLALSDERTKRSISGAGSKVADAIRSTDVTYPAIEGNDYRAVEPGNIDLQHRPYVRNPDGSVSTVLSMGANVGGREVLMPKVSQDGRIMSDDEAIANYRRTGQHMGIYRNARESDAAGQAIHEDQMRMPPEDTLMGAGSAARGPRDLVFSSDDGGTFRSPAEQYDFAAAHGGAPRAEYNRVQPTPLVFSGGEMRSPEDAYSFAQEHGGQRLPMSTEASVSHAFAPAGSYAYKYKDPSAPGAEAGPQYGPMAQELEQTPAGRTVVGERGGRKFIDTDRLSLLNASATGQLRRELDHVNKQLASLGQMPAATAPVARGLGYR